MAGGNKPELRRALRSARRSLSADLRREFEAALTGHLDELNGVIGRERSRQILGFLPMPTEPPILAGLARLHALGWDVLMPRCLPDRELEWVRWSPEAEARRSELASVEELHGPAVMPSGDAIVLVPALGIGLDGTRLGQGGGYYDGFLANRSPRSVQVAVVFDDEVALPAVPADPWDARVAKAMTPSGWWSLTPPQPDVSGPEMQSCPRWDRTEPSALL